MPAIARIRTLAALPFRPVRFIARELWTPIAMWRTNSMIRRRAVSTGGPIATLSDADLSKLIEAEWTRGKELDDKLQKLTAALSVSVTVGGLVGSTMLQDLTASGWKIAAAVLFLLAAALLLTGVLIGFNGLRPKPRYGYGAGYLSIVAAGGDTARKEMIAAARSFERDNLLRANEAAAAIVSIRNGVLVFASAMLVGLVAAALGKATAEYKTIFSNGERPVTTRAKSTTQIPTTITRKPPVTKGLAPPSACPERAGRRTGQPKAAALQIDRTAGRPSGREKLVLRIGKPDPTSATDDLRTSSLDANIETNNFYIGFRIYLFQGADQRLSDIPLLADARTLIPEMNERAFLQQPALKRPDRFPPKYDTQSRSPIAS
ncbi:hypothetical protein [Sphingomonas mucosissima]|uniref:Uncharacterized protein n=1 Tax=Sphingomonas mucosissima TaxID=370959 RepID=A0A245ZQI4_9SPHN|nr:hypothetical protein [Sphingomonas mucosissima]OWK32007.1 hypothetical protein SPMU_03280 [Sphingomonas mucosissima]